MKQSKLFFALACLFCTFLSFGQSLPPTPDTLYLQDGQNIVGKVRRFGGYTVKVYSLQNGNARRPVYYYSYRKIDSLSLNTFDRKGRTFQQVVMQRENNSRLSVGVGTLNVGFQGFVDYPIVETQNISLRANTGFVSFWNQVENYNEKGRVSDYTITRHYFGSSAYFGQGQVVSSNIQKGYDKITPMPRPGFFFDVEARGYFTARKSAFKPYIGMAIGFNHSTIPTTYFVQTYSHQSQEVSGTPPLDYTQVNYTHYDVHTYVLEKKRMKSHAAFTTGAEFYFGQRIAFGVGYKCMIINRVDNPRYIRQDFGANREKISEERINYSLNDLTSHILTVEAKYLINWSKKKSYATYMKEDR